MLKAYIFPLANPRMFFNIFLKFYKSNQSSLKYCIFAASTDTEHAA